MTPAAALEEQIKRYRQMTGEQWSKVALDLHISKNALPPFRPSKATGMSPKCHALLGL
jgi:hypothetical protein